VVVVAAAVAAAGNRSIAHVDMDAFYASVEIRENPELKGLPVVVGGDPDKRGVVAAASYEARRYGVHSAMPSRTAVRLCPDLVFVHARHELYAKVSQQIRGILERYTPTIEPLALDEAFLDITSSRRLWGEAQSIGRRIKAEIKHELDLTASVGIAPNKFIAKLASDLDKPDGLVIVEADGIQQLLDPLPVSRIWGVGKSGERRLRQLGVTTIQDLRTQSESELEERFGVWGRHIWKLARGIDDRPVITDTEAKSISHETTFERDIADPEVLAEVLLGLTEQVATRLRRHNRYARKVNLKVRYGDFTTVSRAHSRDDGTNITREIWQTARTLLARMLNERPDPVRLLGIGVSGLDKLVEEQTDLFDASREKQRELDNVTDDINRRFGSRILRRGVNQRSE
jgi:DNA polymerase-4